MSKKAPSRDRNAFLRCHFDVAGKADLDEMIRVLGKQPTEYYTAQKASSERMEREMNLAPDDEPTCWRYSTRSYFESAYLDREMCDEITAHLFPVAKRLRTHASRKKWRVTLTLTIDRAEDSGVRGFAWLYPEVIALVAKAKANLVVNCVWR